MNERIETIIRQMKRLEDELLAEMQRKQEAFAYEIKDRRVRFEEAVRRQHKSLMQHIPSYLMDSTIPNMLTVPVIWAVLLPAMLIDAAVTIYQFICFPIYGIPKVRRADYIVIDRQYLSYLNLIEKLNCIYCGYVNGLLGFMQEVVARTEQFWCPIKHARKIRGMHRRYKHFLDYGDAEAWRERFEEVRRDFGDIKKPGNGGGSIKP